MMHSVSRSALVIVGLLLAACGGDDPNPTCGDGVLGPEEVCDGASLGGLSCETQGFGPGTLGCSASCVPDTSACGAPPTCGDGELSAPEVCDGDLLDGATCESEGFGAGELGCASNCGAFDTEACAPPPGCGDGVIGEDEVCDGDVFASDCESLGFGPGTLSCDRCVSVDTSACSCLPTTCEAEGANCGEIDDGCGGTLDCGTMCADEWLTCGGAGTDNRCGATCELSCPGGGECDELGTCPYAAPLEGDVRTVAVTFRVLRNGVAPTDLVDCSVPERIVGWFRVNNPGLPGGIGGGSVRCGTNWTVQANLPPGDYVYSVRGRSEADTNMPLSGFLGEVQVPPGGGEVVVDVPLHRVQGNLRFGDIAPEETASCAPGQRIAQLRFDTTFFAGDQDLVTDVVCGSDFAFDVGLYPGEWEVHLENPSRSRSNVGDARRLTRSFVVDAPTTSAVIDLSDQRVRLTGTLRFGGVVPVGGPGCFSNREAARMTLFRDGEFEAFAQMPCDGDFSYELLAEPGEYELVYRTSRDVTDLPTVRVSLGTMVLDADTTIDIELPRRTIEGTVLLDGLPLPETPECLPGMAAGVVRAQDKVFELVCGAEGAYSLTDLSPVEYPCTLDGCTTPTSTEYQFLLAGFPGMLDLPSSIRMNVDLADPREPFDLNFETVVPVGREVSVQVSVDGMAPEETCEAGTFVGSVTLFSPSLQMRESVLCGSEFTGFVRVPDGEYRVEVSGSEFAAVPTYTTPSPINVVGGTSIVVDVPTAMVSGQVLVNGEVPVRTDECTRPEYGANVLFYDLRHRIPTIPTASFFLPCETTDFTFDGRLAVGTYRVAVSPSRIPLNGPTGSTIPNFEYTLVERLEVR